MNKQQKQVKQKKSVDTKNDENINHPTRDTGYTTLTRILNKRALNYIFESNWKLFTTILIFRLINSLTTKTFFQPDEFYQSLEPAIYKLNKSGYLTWEWSHGLRSFIYPLIYFPIYKAVDYLSLSHWWMVHSPKIFNAFLSAIGEVYFYRLTVKVTKDPLVSKLCILLSLTSCFNWFLITRSFANCIELHLTVISMFYFPFNNLELESSTIKFMISLLIAGVSCLIRPTNAIFWLFFGIILFFQTKRRLRLFIITGFTVTSIFSLELLVNYYFGLSNENNTVINTNTNTGYDEHFWRLPLLKFIDFNFTKNLSSFYGVSSASFYFVQGLPILLMTNLPFFIIGWVSTPTTIHNGQFLKFKILVLVYCISMSLIQHKEFRFVYPLMPILLMISAYGWIKISNKLSAKLFKLIGVSVLLVNAIIGIYLTVVHESGVIEITQVLRNKLLQDVITIGNDDNKNNNKIIEVGFLTPCHSTPFQSHFDLPQDGKTHVWFLTCDPPFSGEDVEGYLDESDYFYLDPIGFIDKNLVKGSEVEVEVEEKFKELNGLPKYLVIFEQLHPVLNDYLEKQLGYVEEERIFNSVVHWDFRRTGDLIIYKKTWA